MDAWGSRITGKTAHPHRGAGRWLALLLATLAMFCQTAAAAAIESRPADSFVESIGVNTHFYYTDTPYVQDFNLVKQRLSELAVRHVRENIAPEDRPDQYQRLRELAAMGIKGDLILGDPRNGISTLDHMLSVVKTELSGALDAVEGPNEFNARGVTNWIPELREYQQHLYTAVKSDPALSSLTVIGPSITNWRQAEELGDISGMLDVGSVHPYTSKPPETVVSEALERSAQNAGTKPTFVTETGYHTALNYTGSESFLPVTEVAQAVYIPRVFLENFRRGVSRTYSYELLNEFPDPELKERESNWGLLRNDLSKKPAFDALRNLIDILKDSGSGFTPGSLDYSLKGNEEKLNQVLLQKRDGSFYLALWRASSVWDPATQTTLNPGSPPISISFNQPISSVQLYVPNVSSSPMSSISNPTGSLSYEVGPEVQILHITPGGTTSEHAGKTTKGHKRLALWTNRGSVRPGQRLALHGRVIAGHSSQSTSVFIQRWRGHWRTVAHGRTSPRGVFRKRIKLSIRRRQRVARIRVVAPAAIPSRSIHVRIVD